MLNPAGMDAQFERLRCAISRGILSVKIEDWTVSGEGFIDFSKTASVAKGNTYTLKVYAEINNVEITPVSLTKTYR